VSKNRAAHPTDRWQILPTSQIVRAGRVMIEPHDTGIDGRGVLWSHRGSAVCEVSGAWVFSKGRLRSTHWTGYSYSSVLQYFRVVEILSVHRHFIIRLSFWRYVFYVVVRGTRPTLA